MSRAAAPRKARPNYSEAKTPKLKIAKGVNLSREEIEEAGLNSYDL